MEADLHREQAADLREHLQEGWSVGIKRGWKAILLSRLEEVLHSSEAELRHANATLAEIFQVWISEADDNVRALATSGTVDGGESLRQAFLLGQLMVAQGLTAHTVRTRADAHMLAALVRYKKYLIPLESRELSNKALADVCNESTAHVTRQLSEMRRAGLVDFRRESKNTINFLTSAAKELLPNNHSREQKLSTFEKNSPPDISIDDILKIGSKLQSAKKAREVAQAARAPSSKHYPPPARAIFSREKVVKKMVSGLPGQYRQVPIFGNLMHKSDFANV